MLATLAAGNQKSLELSRLLLRDAVDTATIGKDLLGVNQNNLSIRINLLKDCLSYLIIWVIK
jgi:hypothetical protein